jgi:hypothetical protein
VNEYTASNGAKVVLTNAGQTGYILAEVDDTVSSAYLGFEQMKAWREFARAEGDERLGRWRWPENPDYVVYPDVDGYGVHNVVSESDGVSLMATRKGIHAHKDTHADAARAYFAAHPEPKPWHNAKPGEVWVVTIDGHARPHYVQDNRGDTVGGVAFVAINPTHGQPGHVGINAPAVTDARRVYPEGDS